ERTQFARARNENGTKANYFNLAANSINSRLDNQVESHMRGAQVLTRSDTANKDAIGIINLLFGILQLRKIRVKTKRFRQLTPSVIWNKVTRPILNQNENQGLEKTQEIQIRRTHENMPLLNSGTRDETGNPRNPKHIDKRNYQRPQAQMDAKRVRFNTGVPHATDRRKAKQQGQTSSIDDARAFWKEHNFDLRVACVRKEYDSEDDSETLQPSKTTRQEFRNRFGRYRNRPLSLNNKRSRYDSPDRGSESKQSVGSRSYSRPREYQGPGETTIDVD
ncbi:MAG: hypothetical protein EZS28_026972, partial [Streblomastix strix]